MENQKKENLLNMALETPISEREKSQNLNVGYNSSDDTWELIVKYNGDIETAISNLEGLESTLVSITILTGGYAIIIAPQNMINDISTLEEVEYIEKPKRLYFGINRVREISCVDNVQVPPMNLNGVGTCFLLIDSGIDYLHPDFCKDDNTSRILFIWDQTLNGQPPQGYSIGTEFNNAQINEAIRSGIELGTVDNSGHGTAVAGVAVSNGRSSGGRYRGIAPEASIIAVKLGNPISNSFPRTTQLMLAVDYAIKKSLELNLPMVINLSFGNSYGSHDGTSLLETFLDNAAAAFRGVICAGVGNEGAVAGHYYGQIKEDEINIAEIVVGRYETTLNVQIWKNYVDELQFSLINPSGDRIEFFQNNTTQRFQMGSTEILVYFGEPRPYSVSQEIYIDFIPAGDYIQDGIWIIEIKGIDITIGNYNIWLPSSEGIGTNTAFLRPMSDNTITIPATANKVISVAAYNQFTDSYADFSGRGEMSESGINIKPDIAAPGVDIMSTRVGGGYASYTGTSFATPVVSGCACLLLQYGIIDNNDKFLYGEKIKAYLRKGARKLPGFNVWPNNFLGYGAVCLRSSLED